MTIRVRPGAGRNAVGGAYGQADDRPVLVVRVAAPAVDGRATEAALRAVAAAFDVRRADVTLVSGATSRTKVVDVDGPPDAVLRRRLDALLTGRDGGEG